MSAPEFHRFRRLGAFLVLVGVVLAALGWFGVLARADQGVRGGVVRLELVGTAAGARDLVDDLHAVDAALRWDLLLIVGYTLVLVGAARLLVPLFRLRAVRTSTGLATGLALVPGLLNLLENLALALALHVGDQVDLGFRAAATLAVAKFALLLTYVPVVVSAVAAGLVTKNWLYALLEADPPEVDDTEVQEQAAPPGMGSGHGLALSGGGVRAAALALGTLQQLERDTPGDGRTAGTQAPLGWSGAAVTGVSGGAYMAGAWSVARGARLRDPQAWAQLGDGRELGPEEQHLMDNLGYLTSPWPRGRPDDPGAPRTLSGAGAASRRARSAPAFWVTVSTGLLVNLVTIAAVVVVLVTPLALGLRFLAGLGGCEGVRGAALPLCLVSQPRIWGAPAAWLVLGVVASVVWVVLSKLITSARATLALKALTLGSLVLGAYLALLLVALPLLIALAQSLSWGLLLAAAGALGGVVGAVVRIVRRFATSLAPKVGGVAFVLLLAVAIGAVAGAAWSQADRVGRFVADPASIDPSLLQQALFVGGFGVLLLVWSFASPELWSLNAYYRGKLRLAYALHRSGGVARAYVNDRDADGVDLVAEPELRQLVEVPDGVASVTICASAHATTKAVRTHYGIPAMSFTFSRDAVKMHVPRDDQGRFTTYACSTDEFAKAYQGAGLGATRRVTTMFAVALSGAAISPAMGRFRIGPTSALLTFANLRLGGWLPNPRYIASSEGRRFPSIRLGYLLKEFFGIHDPTDPFVYVSDGGHWENTGLVELLREQMPHEVVLVDADSGPAARLGQLTQAIDLVKLECGVDVFVDLDPLRGFLVDGHGPLYAERPVTVGILRHGGRYGLLWYTRPVLTRTTPTPLLAHREAYADFPTTSTLDQFFDTSTYVAYRDLGRHNATEVMLARKALEELLSTSGDPDDPRPGLRASGGWVGPTFAALLDQFEDPERAEVLAQIRGVFAHEPDDPRTGEVASVGGAAETNGNLPPEGERSGAVAAES